MRVHIHRPRTMRREQRLLGWTMWRDFEGGGILRCGEISKKYGKLKLQSISWLQKSAQLPGDYGKFL